MNAEKLVQKAVIDLIIQQPFFGALIMQLPRIADKSIPTMCTNGRELRWNPDFVEKLDATMPQLVVSALAHEICHCAFGHIFRRGGRDPKRFNVAADYAVHCIFDEYNEIDRQAKRVEPLPIGKDWLFDPAYKGKCCEEIYGMLPEPPPGGGNGSPSDGSGDGPGEVQDSPGSPSEKAAQESEWKINVAEAARIAQQAGKLPAGLAHFVAKLLKPVVDWREVLRRFVSATAKDSYSWTRPNRRFIHAGIYLPGLHSQRMGRLACVRDTSGSISDEMLCQFTGEIQSILDECMPEKLVMMDCDAAVGATREYEPGDVISRQVCGRGGTSFIPAIEAVEHNPPVCMVYLTDLDGTFPDVPPAYPVLWITPNDQKAPFGETVKMEL